MYQPPHTHTNNTPHVDRTYAASRLRRLAAAVADHVPAGDMAQFVGDHALQFVATQAIEGSAGDRDGGIAGRVSGSEGVDRRLAV